MVDKTRWKYRNSLTVRVEDAEKARLQDAAQAKGILFSEYIRSILKDGKLPEELLAQLSPRCRARVEKLAERSGKDAASMLLDLIPGAIPALFDNVSYGV